MSTAQRPPVARRAAELPPYLFAALNRRIAAKRAEGVDVISLGIGDPDTPAPAHVVAALQRAVADGSTHRYPTNFGRRIFREAVAAFYRRRFDVVVDPDTEVFPLLGSKEGIAHLCLALLDPGRVALVPDPGYPVYARGATLADARPVPVRLEPPRFVADLSEIAAEDAEAAGVLFLNYPNNPTGAVLEPGDDLFGQAVSFGRRTGTWIVHDQSYSETTFDGYRAPSFLETPGAGEVGVELFSLSKAYNMTGFRCAAAVGNAELIETLWRLKTNIDTGMSDFVQIAAAEALTGSQQHVEEMCTLYAHRRDLLVGALRDIGLNAVAPKATIYVWVPVPAGHTDASFADLVLDQAGVAITPGSAYGRMGEGFVRMSLTTPDDLLHEAVDRICRSLSL